MPASTPLSFDELFPLLDQALQEEPCTALAAALENRTVPREALSLFGVFSGDRSDIIRLLIQHGADPSTSGPSMAPPLCFAGIYGAVECARALLEGGAEVNQAVGAANNPITWAMEASHIGEGKGEAWRKLRRNKREICKLLAERHCRVNGVGPYTNSPLHSAAAFGEAADVQLMLELGAELDLPLHRTGVTPLMRAAQQDNPETFQTLLALGADVNKVDGAGLSALDYAQEEGRVEIPAFLRQKAQQAALEAQVSTPDNVRPRM